MNVRYRVELSQAERDELTATYEPGDWERTLLDWPEPVPF